MDLLARWARALAPWGAPADRIDAAGRDVLARYGEGHRVYHTAEHVLEVLAVLGDLIDLARHPEAVELAGWLHDVVYDPTAGPGISEDASAEYASAVLGSLHVDDAVVSDVARLIRTTTAHRPATGDADGAVLADADLWILASSPTRYRRYAAGVRVEYVHVPDGAWRAGRSALLSDFADRPRLYLTDRAHAALDDRARRNLAWELSTLGGGEPQA